jgi:hypothetical protein
VPHKFGGAYAVGVNQRQSERSMAAGTFQLSPEQEKVVMNSTLGIVLFFVAGSGMAYIAIRYRTYEAQMKAVPRASLCVMALGCLLWGTGDLFQLYGSSVLAHVFTTVGAVLFVINIPLLFLQRAVKATPPVRRNQE